MALHRLGLVRAEDRSYLRAAAAQEGIAPRAPGQQAHPSADRGLRAHLPGRVRAGRVAAGGQGARARPHRDEPAARGADGARAPRDDLRPAREATRHSASARRPSTRTPGRSSMRARLRSSPAARSRSSRATSTRSSPTARAGSSISRARPNAGEGGGPQAAGDPRDRLLSGGAPRLPAEDGRVRGRRLRGHGEHRPFGARAPVRQGARRSRRVGDRRARPVRPADRRRRRDAGQERARRLPDARPLAPAPGREDPQADA